MKYIHYYILSNLIGQFERTTVQIYTHVNTVNWISIDAVENETNSL